MNKKVMVTISISVKADPSDQDSVVEAVTERLQEIIENEEVMDVIAYDDEDSDDEDGDLEEEEDDEY